MKYTPDVLALSVLLGVLPLSGAVQAQSTTATLVEVLNDTGAIDGFKSIEGAPSSFYKVAGDWVFGRPIDELLETFGQAAKFEVSEKEGSPVAVCYAAEKWIVVLRAGAMGGWNRVTGVTITTRDQISFAEKCKGSKTLGEWMAKQGNSRLVPAKVARQLRLSVLPPKGAVADRKAMVGKKPITKTTVIAYAGGSKELRWIDISEFVER